ncbi:340_t:CDS:1, partial [Ambispora gerdemannii]
QIESNINAPDVIFPRHNFFAREPPQTAVIERYQYQQISERSQESLDHHPIILPLPTIHALTFSHTSTPSSRFALSSHHQNLHHFPHVNIIALTVAST